LTDITEALKKHKTALAIGAAGIVLFFILRGGSSSTNSNSNDALQIAQLQAQQNTAQAQIQAQQNTAQISATTADTQTAAELEAQQNQLAVTTALGLQSQGSQAQLQQEALQAEVNQNASYESLVEGIAPSITAELQNPSLGPIHAESAENELGLLLGNPSGLGTYDSTVEGAGNTENTLDANSSNAELLAILSLLGGSGSGSSAAGSLLGAL
jgi:multidrug efflux pump subunit AcrA (membrane-fusion protein)